MDIIQTIDSADKSATVYLNNDMGSVADITFWTLSSRLIWVPVALFFIYCIFKNNNRNWRMTVLAVITLAITIAMCDQIASSLFKPWIARLRPSHNLQIADLLHYVNNYHGGLYGFMSSHAANAFGAAVFGSRIIKKRYFTIFIFSLALIVSYSRIYLGVHYLGDVVCGAITGMCVGYLIYMLFKYIHTRFAMFNPMLRAQRI